MRAAANDSALAIFSLMPFILDLERKMELHYCIEILHKTPRKKTTDKNIMPVGQHKPLVVSGRLEILKIPFHCGFPQAVSVVYHSELN